MKRFYLLTMLALCLGCTILSAQNNNCGDVIPNAVCPADLVICPSELTTAPTITNAASLTLPDLEYAIIDPAQISTAGTGPVVVGFDDDGIFAPSTFGNFANGQLEIIPMNYDLALIQNVLNSLLKNDVFPLISCCSQAGTICADLNAVGIFCGSDITSLSQLLDLQLANGTDTFSIFDFVTEINNLNAQLGAAPSSCGGGNTLCYTYGNTCTYTIVPNTVSINTPHNMNETVQAALLITSTATVNTGLTVIYQAGQCVELLPPFEVQAGANFTAEIQVCN